jgi:hypothetical protein
MTPPSDPAELIAEDEVAVLVGFARHVALELLHLQVGSQRVDGGSVELDGAARRAVGATTRRRRDSSTARPSQSLIPQLR